MNLTAIIDELRTERDLIIEAILSLERVAGSRGRKRGRPPGWLSAMLSEAEAKPERQPGTKKRTRAKRKRTKQAGA